MEHAQPRSSYTGASLQLLALPAFVMLCWALAIRHLSSEWTMNEQYHYGWFVPWLSIYLIRIRFESRPPATTPVLSMGSFWLVCIAVGICEALLLPIQEANPDWRLLGWLLTGLAALLTLAVFYFAGGGRWTMHFMYPVLFFFSAVPWPRPLEIEVMHQLMQRQAELGAELLAWCGVIAEARGNVIALAGGAVGVDEACSGIRSLQASLMMALFIGEVFQLRPARRVMFLLAGAVWATLANTARTMTLASLAGSSGPEAVERWHDPVGYSVLAVCLVGMVGLGFLLRPPARARRVVQPSMPESGQSAVPSCFFAGARWECLAGMVLICAGWGATKWWFLSHESKAANPIVWRFDPPLGNPEFTALEPSSRLRAELRYDTARISHWRDEAGRRWMAQFFVWMPGRDSVRTVAVHDPRACLAATGMTLVQVLPSVAFAQGVIELEFDAYWFKDAGGDVFVYNCVVEDVERSTEGRHKGQLGQTFAARLEATLAGQRNLGLRRLEVAVWGTASPEEAQRLLADLLKHQVRDLP